MISRPHQKRSFASLCRRATFLLALCAFAAFQTGAAPPTPLSDYIRDQWQTERGLPQNSVYALVQDQQGFLWVGTADGLARFDGVHFETFRASNTEGLRHSFVYRLILARDGTLWGGTRGGGIFSWSDGKFRSVSSAEGLSNDHVWALAEGLDGSIWVGTRQGLNRYHQGEIIRYTLEDGLPDEHITALHCMPDGTLWIGGANSKLARFRDGHFEVFEPPVKRPDMPIQAFASAGDLLYVGYDALGVFPFRDGRFGAPLPATKGHLVQAITQDPAGGLWVATKEHGVIYCQGKQSGTYCTTQGLSHDDTAALLIDREGSIWIGTVSGGLNRIRPPKVRTFTARHGLLGEDVTCTFEDHAGVLWVGTRHKGLFRFSEGGFEPVPSHGLKTTVRALVATRDNALWIGTAGRGLLRLADGVLTSPLEGENPGDSITSLFEDRSGLLWIGSEQAGLCSFDPEDRTLRRYPLPPGSARYIRSFGQDKDGIIWVGTQEGLFRQSPSGFQRVTDQGLLNISAWDLHFDAEGVLWIGTRDHGIVRYTGSSAFFYDTENGLPNNLVHRILESGTNFWFSGNQGIRRVARNELERVALEGKGELSLEMFDEKDGLLTSESNGGYSPSGTLTRDGRLWFPTKRGLAMIDPGRLWPNTNLPPVVIQSVQIDGNPHPMQGVLQVPPGTTRLQIKYTALSFRAPSKVLFRHRLSGVDKNWVEAGARRDAAYYNLQPGDYTFSVIACNEEGLWNTSGANLSLVVAPLFYQTWWFYGLAGSALFSVGLMGYRWRVRAVSQKAAELEHMVNSRTSELARTNQKLEAEIQERKRAEEALHLLPQKIFQAQEGERRRVARELHDSVNQPIASIKFRVQTAEQQIARGDGRWVENCRRTKDLLDSVLNQVRRISHNLRPSELDDFGLAPAAEAACEEFQARTGLEIAFRSPGLPERLPGPVEITLYRILQEALTNIEKHSHATRVSIHLTAEDGYATLEIVDNGIGFHRQGNARPGLGLLHLRERAAFIGGVLDLKTAPGQGVRITIHVPIAAQPTPAHA